MASVNKELFSLEKTNSHNKCYANVCDECGQGIIDIATFDSFRIDISTIICGDEPHYIQVKRVDNLLRDLRYKLFKRELNHLEEVSGR